MFSMQSNLYQFQKRQIVLMARVTPYAMAGHIANTTVIAIALAGSVRPAPLIIWCAYSYATALFLLYRHVRNRRRWPLSFQRAAKKATIYAFLLALPWSSLALLYLGSVSHGEELLLVALGAGMAACGTVLLSAIPSAAFSYMSVVLLPSALKYFLVGQKGYLLLGTLALSYWACLAALIAKTGRDNRERQESELTLAERNTQLELASKSARVGSFSIDLSTGIVKLTPGCAAIYGLPEDTIETSCDELRKLVHPEDLPELEALRDQTFLAQQREFIAQSRIVRANDAAVRWLEVRSLIFFDQVGKPSHLIGVNIDVTERKRAEERQSVLVAELDHRVKNVLANVCAVVSHTRQESASVVDFVAALDGRFRSLAMAHELLSSGGWQGISLTELVRRELAPYATPHNTKISGPEIVLRPEAGQAMAMVLHELATNAAKYGALSTSNGGVSIRWHRRMNGQSRSSLVLEWQEMGGPPVVATGKPSYGTSTICDLIPYEFGGTVDLALAQDGVRCYLELPADWLSNDGEPVSRVITRANDRQEISALKQVALKALQRDAKSYRNETRGPQPGAIASRKPSASC
jgi:PAS domain S-box-containing protein